MLKVRIKFAKHSVMKFIGHLDVMRYFQKALRRAEIEVKFSEGMSPHMIMSFAAPLGVGLTSDGEYVDIQLKAGQVTKTELPTGQHLLEFLSTENPNIKVEKMVDFPESGKNYLVVVNELKAAVAPPMPQASAQQAPPQNPYLDQLNQMQWNNPLVPPAMPQMPPPMPGGNNN